MGRGDKVLRDEIGIDGNRNDRPTRVAGIDGADARRRRRRGAGQIPEQADPADRVVSAGRAARRDGAADCADAVRVARPDDRRQQARRRRHAGRPRGRARRARRLYAAVRQLGDPGDRPCALRQQRLRPGEELHADRHGVERALCDDRRHQRAVQDRARSCSPTPRRIRARSISACPTARRRTCWPKCSRCRPAPTSRSCRTRAPRR